MKSSKASSACVHVCAYSSFFFLLLVCLLDLVIVRTSEEGRRALNLVNKRMVDSKMFIRWKKNKTPRLVVFFNINYTYKMRNWRSDFRSSFRISDRLLNCNSLKRKEKLLNRFLIIQRKTFPRWSLWSELYHKPLYDTSCVRCGNRFLFALLFIADNLSNITLYWRLGKNHHTRFSYFHISCMSIMQIWTSRKKKDIV
jgi:hypothetical protein